MKLLQERRARLGRGGFMIADPEVEGRVTPGFDLVFDEVIPGIFLIVAKVGGLALANVFFDVVLIGANDPAQVSQVPVERYVVLQRICRDRRHDYIATVSRVTGDSEGPSLCRRIC